MMVKHDLSSFTNDMRMNAPMIGINLIIIVINIVFSIIVIILLSSLSSSLSPPLLSSLLFVIPHQ